MKLLNYRIPTHSEDWYLFRTKGLTAAEAKAYKMPAYEGGIGGSEVGAIMGLSPYISSLEIFYHKIGYTKPRSMPSEAAMWGIIHEDNIKKAWSHYTGDEDYINNVLTKTKIRKCTNRTGYFINSEIPFLFASPDGIINKNQVRLDTGEINPKNGVLECKSINSREVAKWESGVPEYYKYQILQYLAVFGLDYAEIAMLVDGSKLQVFPLEYTNEDKDRLFELAYEFWYKRVIPGRQAYELMMQGLYHNDKDVEEEGLGLIHSLEPEPDSSLPYEQFMKEIAIRDVMSVDCTEDEEFKKIVTELAATKTLGKAVGTYEQLLKNQAIKKLHDLKTEKADFGDIGYARLYERSNGTVVFDLRVKNENDYTEQIKTIL